MSLAKKPFTALSQDAEVGVKWNVQRGFRANHWRTFGCIDDGVDQLLEHGGIFLLALVSDGVQDLCNYSGVRVNQRVNHVTDAITIARSLFEIPGDTFAAVITGLSESVGVRLSMKMLVGSRWLAGAASSTGSPARIPPLLLRPRPGNILPEGLRVGH